jgi:NTP pyrophosphatase (non-canonical NTP hydrolase)
MDLKDLEEKYKLIDKYFEENFPQLRGDYKILARLGKITEELGELNSAVHSELNLQREEKQAAHTRENLEAEWADVFNTVMLFGLTMNIDMEKAIGERVQKIFERYNIEGARS